MERLNFSARDWDKLESCALSVKHLMGVASGPPGNYDEEALQEAGEDDNVIVIDNDQNVDNVDAMMGGRDVSPQPRPPSYPPPPTELQPRPPSHPPPSKSSQPRPPYPPPSSSSCNPKARPLRKPVPSSEHVQQPAESPEVPPPPPPHPEMLARRRRVAPAAAPQLKANPPGMSGCRGVKRLNEELAEPLSIIVSGMCPLCKMPRAECFRPGDWGCPVCGQHNYPDKLVCTNYRCKAKKGVAVLCAPGPPAPPAPPPAPSSWCDSCRRPRSECWKPND